MKSTLISPGSVFRLFQITILWHHHGVCVCVTKTRDPRIGVCVRTNKNSPWREQINNSGNKKKQKNNNKRLQTEDTPFQ